MIKRNRRGRRAPLFNALVACLCVTGQLPRLKETQTNLLTYRALCRALSWAPPVGRTTARAGKKLQTADMRVTDGHTSLPRGLLGIYSPSPPVALTSGCLTLSD